MPRFRLPAFGRFRPPAWAFVVTGLLSPPVFADTPSIVADSVAIAADTASVPVYPARALRDSARWVSAGLEKSFFPEDPWRVNITSYHALGRGFEVGLPMLSMAWLPTRKEDWYSLNIFFSALAFGMFGACDDCENPRRFNDFNYDTPSHVVHLIQAVPNATLARPLLSRGRLYVALGHRTELFAPFFERTREARPRFRYEQLAGIGGRIGPLGTQAGVAMPWLPLAGEDRAPRAYVGISLAGP